MLRANRLSLVNITLVLMFLISPFVDGLTGFLIGNGLFATNSPLSPSQIFRFILMAILLIQIKGRKLIDILIVFIYLVIIDSFNFLFYTFFPGLISGIIAAYKLTFNITAYILLKKYIDESKISLLSMIQWFTSSASIYSIIVIISNILGISFGSYGDGLGSKGIFASANGLGIFIGTGAMFAFFLFKETKKNKENFLLIGAICSMLSVLLGLLSKAAIVSVIILLVCFFIYQKKEIKICTLIITAVAMVWFSPLILETMSASTEVIMYRWEHRENILSFMFSGRSEYLANALKMYNSTGILILRILWGGGYFLSFRDPFSSLFWEKSSCFLEAELFDMFFMYGIIGVIGFLILWLCAGIKLIKKKNKYKFIPFCAWLMLFIHSSIAGHVLFNGMSSIAVVVVFVYAMTNKKIHQNERSLSVT